MYQYYINIINMRLDIFSGFEFCNISVKVFGKKNTVAFDFLHIAVLLEFMQYVAVSFD